MMFGRRKHIHFYVERSHRDEIRAFAALCGRNSGWSEQQIVQELRLHGASAIYAEVLTAFVPLALFRAVMKRMESAKNVALPQHGFAPDARSGKQYRIEFSQEPVYLAALELGEETFENGIIPRADMSAASNSGERDAINGFLQSGESLESAVFRPTLFPRLAETRGFFERYGLQK